MATFISGKISSANTKETFWGDFLSEEEFSEWKSQAMKNLPGISSRIKHYIDSPNKESDLIADLFYVTELNNLTLKRWGYYYGAEIVAQYFDSKSLALDVSYDDLRPYFLSYFQISGN